MNLFNLTDADAIASLEQQLADVRAQLATAIERTKPCYARRKAIKNRLANETDLTRRACLEQALTHVELVAALSDQGESPNVI